LILKLVIPEYFVVDLLCHPYFDAQLGSETVYGQLAEIDKIFPKCIPHK
jgi:hypothetical protein